MKKEAVENNAANEKTEKLKFSAAVKNTYNRIVNHRVTKEYGYLLWCLLIPTVLIYLIYLARGAHPFGDGCVLVLDLGGQYVWFFEALRNFVRGDANLLYSFSRQLGGEFLGIYAYYLASPLSFLVSLFPKKRMLEALLALFMLKGGLCGATFGFYMHKTSKKPNKIAIVIFSASYALCSYAIIQQHNTMWIDAVMWLPLITLGIESIIKHGKFKLYVVSLAIAVFSNYYIGYMLCIYCAIYFFIYYFGNSAKFRNNPTRERLHFIRSLGRIVGYSILAIGIAAVIIISAYYSLNFGKTTFSDPSWKFEWKFDLTDFFFKLLPASYYTVRPDGLPFIYCGVLTLLLVPAYFASKKFTVREKICSAILLLILFFSFSINIIDLVWHGFQKPNWLNYRYSFMFSFYLCVLACRAMSNLDKKPPHLTRFIEIAILFVMIVQGIKGRYGGDIKVYRTIFLPIFIAVVFAYFLMLIITNTVKKKHSATFVYVFGAVIEFLLCGLIIVMIGYGIKNRYGETKAYSSAFFYFALIAVFVYLLVLAVIYKSKKKQMVTFALACIVIVELFVNGLFGLNSLVTDVGASTYSRYNDYLNDLRPIVEKVQDEDDSFYRMEKTFYRSNNDNMALNMRGLSGSTSTLNEETIRFLNSLGYASKSHWTKYLGNTVVTDSLLGVRYLISDQSIYGNYYDVFTADDKYTAYLNPYALSLAYGVSDDLLDFELGYVKGTQPTPDADAEGQELKDGINSIKGQINEWLNIEENNGNDTYADNYRNPFDRINAILGAMLGEEEPIPVFVPISSTVAKTNNVKYRLYNNAAHDIGYTKIASDKGGSITMKTTALPADAEIFFYSQTGFPREVSLYLSVDGGELVSKGTFNGNNTTRIVSLGMQKKDTTLSLRMTLKADKLFIEKDAQCFWYIDMALFEETIARLAQNQFKIEEYTERSIEGTYTASRANDLVLTTIPYDNGWEVWVDGERVEITKALGALISFHVGGEAGQEHDIRLVYNPKAIGIGLIISIVSILIFILLIVLDRFFHFGCKLRPNVNYNDGRGEDDDEQNIDDAALEQEPDAWDTFKGTSKKVLHKLNVIFIPPKRKKYVHHHSKKKKKKKK